MSNISDPISSSFAVVIPAYNEASGIRACITEVASILKEVNLPCRLIVVDDGSKDQTSAILDKAAAEVPELIVVHHPSNLGYGAALRTGVSRTAELQYRYVLFMDSDLTNAPADIPRFVEKMAEGFDVIKASRFISGGGTQGVPGWRKALSVFGNRVASALFKLPIRDCTNGFRAIRTDLLQAVKLVENGFPIIMEELFRLAPLARTYAELPVILRSRSDEQRGSIFSYSPRTLLRYLKYPLLQALGRWGIRNDGN